MEKLIKKIVIEGKTKAITGLHIGGSNTALSIGGPDAAVIRNPIDNKPYIPGSSLKGKMRALIEITDGTIRKQRMGQVEFTASDDPDHISVKLFGNATNDKPQHASRVIVRDCHLLSDDSLFDSTDLPYSESKVEVVIDRITSKAMPRQIERVPSGAEFGLNMILNVFEKDDEKELVENLFRGLKLVQDDYLGGSGSRGSGQVSFTVEKLDERTFSFYSGNEEEKSVINKYLDLLKRFELC